MGPTGQLTNFRESCWNCRSLNYGCEFVNVEIVFRTAPLMSYVESDGWTGGSDKRH